ncbi:MAG TPA: hypothetical protein PLL72_03970 [Burkholderiaceae bacterium]|nr:hypothetical protein [Burkholderiaceae bacterium]
MMLRSRAGPRNTQPLTNAAPNSRLPPAFLRCRPRDGGSTPLYIDSQRGAILSGTGYTGITLDQSRVGWGVKSAAGTSDGIVLTLSSSGTNWGRTTYCAAFRVRIDSVPGSAGTICSFNGALSGLQVRINSSSQLQILAEANALLDTSTYAGFTAGSIHDVVVLCSAALNAIMVWANGSLIINYTGTQDNKDPATAMEVALLRRGNTGEKLAGTLFGFSFWSGVGLVPSPAHCREMSAAPGTYAAYRPRRRVRPLAAASTPKTATASLAAAIQVARTATASIAAAIQTSRTATTSAAAAVQVSRTASASAAVAVQAGRTATASVATAVQAAHTATASLAAAVQRGVTASASLATAVQAARSATASVAAAVQAPQTATASINAYVQAGSSVTASLSAAVQAARTAQASVSLAVRADRTAQASLAAAIATAQSVTASLSAGVQQARSASASISAQIQAGTTIVALLAAAIREARAASASIAAAVAVARSASASLSAAVAVQRSLSALFGAAAQVGRSATSSLSAYVSAPGDHTISPRLYLIDPEDRTYIVPASSRSTAA